MPEIVLGSGNLYCKLIYSVNQNVANNTSTITVALKDMQLKGGSKEELGTAWLYPGGTIKINGTTLCTTLLNNTQGINVSLSNSQFRTVAIVGPGSWSDEQISPPITHNNDGTASAEFSVSIRVGSMKSDGSLNEWYGINVSQTVSLPTIGRASSLTSASDRTLGQSCSVSWIPLSASFWYKLKFSIGSWSYTTGSIYPNQTTEYTYTGYTISTSAAYQIPNSTTGTMTVTLMTYSDSGCSQQVGADSSKTFTVTVQSSAIPTLTGQAATIVNSNSIVNGWGVAVANMTAVKLNGTASGSFGSTIKSYVISGGYTTTTTTWPYTGSILNKAGYVSFTIQVVDSRGRKSNPVTTSEIYFYPYSVPSIISFSVSRDAANAAIANVTARFSFSSIYVNNAEKNSVTAQLSYKLSSASSWSTVAITNNETKLISISDTSSYDFKLTVRDALNNTVTAERYISTMEAVMSFGANGKGLGIGKVAESSNLEIGFKTIFFDELFIRIGSNNILLKDYIKGVIDGTYT